MRQLATKFEWILDKSEFFERLFVMREIFDGQVEEDDEEGVVACKSFLHVLVALGNGKKQERITIRFMTPSSH